MTINELYAISKWVNILGNWAVFIEINPEKLKKRVRNYKRDENSRYIYFYSKVTLLRFDFEKLDDGFRVFCFNLDSEEFVKAFPLEWLEIFFK